MFIVALTLFLNAQTTPYLVMPKTRPELRSSAASSAKKASVPSADVPSATDSTLREFRKGVLDIVNQERKKRGLSQLKENPLLDQSAQAHADDMIKRNFFSHETPDGKKPEDRIRAVGYFVKPCDCAVNFSYGENVAKGQKSAKAVMADWMKSKVHRENILKREFKEFGLGYSGGLWVQNFGGIEVVK